MPITWTYVTAPSAEPVTREEAKLHLHEDGAEQDTYIDGLIAAAREYFEGATGRALMPCTIREKFDDFPESGCPIRLAVSPVRSVSSVTYLDTAGTSTTLAASNYRVDSDSEPARIEEAYATAWPVTRGVVNGVTIDYPAGYATAADVPQSMKHCLLLLIGHWFENREAVNVGNIVSTFPLAVQSLIDRWALYTRG